MIVKNESAVIERCLKSILPLIDAWVVVDTGSTDATQAIVRNTLKDLPGKIVNDKWVNFSHNRNTGLRHAAGMADYIFIIDADEIMRFPEGFAWPAATADMSFIECEYGDVKYMRAQLLRSSISWKYKGVVHEFADSHQPHTHGNISGIQCIPSPEGSRSQNPVKFQHDALLLSESLAKNPGNSRDVFYLAQSHRDFGDHANAIKYYKQRVDMGGWTEEVWYSLYQIACLKHRQQEPWAVVQQAMLDAYNYAPHRAETLYYLCRENRLRNDFHSSILFAEAARKIPYPHNGLFVEWQVYKYRILDEQSISLYNLKRFAESAAMCQQILEMGVSEERIKNNLQFALQGMNNAI